jgi:hypothetical protein
MTPNPRATPLALTRSLDTSRCGELGSSREKAVEMRWSRLAVCQWRVGTGPSLADAYLKYQLCDELTATSNQETTIYCNLSPRDGE